MKNVDEITALITASKKYSGLSNDLILRIYEQEYPKYKKEKDLIKAIRKELHIIHGSYLREDSMSSARQLFDH
ncbi:MAG TPA: hypothetical protein VFF80_01495, partial [Bacillota bacterium]|nr:hypothetical protein [Bacillota bacterium]